MWNSDVLLVAGFRSGGASHADDARKWWALAVLLLAQVMIILDIAIVNIAVPSAQASLHIAPTHIQWIVTAYLLPFGGLLLLGGRIADFTGRKRVFCIATLGFAISSGIGGLAGSEAVLFAARACQGLFAAGMAPALLSMLSLGFPDDPDRGRAFSCFGGVSAAGGAFGLVIGGFLTQYLSWRWSLLINVPLSAIVVVGALPLLRESRTSAAPTYDVVGAVLGTLGLLGVIYGIANIAQNGWGATGTVVPVAAGAVLIAAFVAWEAMVSDPLMPLSILRDRRRAGAFLSLASLYGPGTGMLLLLLVFLQGPLHERALTAGLHFMPIPVSAGITAVATMRVMRTVSPRVMVIIGTVLGAAGLLAATRIGVHASFVGDMVPAFALFGFGSAILFVVANALALSDVPDGDAGLTGGVLSTMQQVGAAVGVAVLSSVATRSRGTYLQHHGPAAVAAAIVHGNNDAFYIGAVMIFASGLVAAALIGNATAARR
jgi:EmrB/QacA subfamily drug resistance transporter